MSDYSIMGNLHEEIQYKVTVWLVTREGKLFIKDVSKDTPFIETGDLTLECPRLRDVFTEAIDLWGIILTQDDLDRIFSEVVQTSTGLVKEMVYILNMDLTPYQMERITHKNNGEFIQFNDIEKFLKQYKKTEHFYYFFYKFLTALEDRLSIGVSSI